jgi:CheY-like chemotaxis protein
VHAREAQPSRLILEPARGHDREEEHAMKTILMVEDNDQIREVVSRSLSAAGYHIIPVGSAEHALDMLSYMRPDLVISDIRLPGIDGVQLCEQLRARPSYQSVPIILLSGCDVDGPAPTCRPEAVLQKPVALEELLRVIGSVLNERAGQHGQVN